MTSRVRRTFALALILGLGVTACRSGAEEKPAAPVSPAAESASDESIDPAETPKSGDVLWQSRDHTSPVKGFAEVDGGFVVTSDESTVGLDPDGVEEWAVREPVQDRQLPFTWVEGGVVVRSILTRGTRDADGNYVEGTIRLRVRDDRKR